MNKNLRHPTAADLAQGTTPVYSCEQTKNEIQQNNQKQFRRLSRQGGAQLGF